MCCFAPFLTDIGLALQTGKSYLSAIKSMQIFLRLLDPREQLSLPLLKRVQAGIVPARMARGMSAKLRFPIKASVFREFTCNT